MNEEAVLSCFPLHSVLLVLKSAVTLREKKMRSKFSHVLIKFKVFTLGNFLRLRH